MELNELAVKKPVESSKQDPVPSRRAVVGEDAIFFEVCAHCGAKRGKPCRESNGSPLQFSVGRTEFSFHPIRIMEAVRTQLTEKMAGNLTAPERMLIVYYAFVMLSEAVAANSTKLFSKAYSAQEIEAFFAQQAITELKFDKMIK